MNTSWTPTRRGFLGLAAAATAGLALTACGTATNTPGGGASNTTGGTTSGAKPIRSGASADTFFVAGFQWGPPTSFSPINASPAFGAAMNTFDIMYEQLVHFNQNDGKIEPCLAKELKETETGFELPLQDGTKWSDGTDLTVDDVLYTFEIAKKAQVSFSSFWTYVEKVEAQDRTIVITLKTDGKNPLIVKDMLCTVPILPKSYYGKLSDADLTKDANLKPIGSGPYMLDKYDATQVIFKRNDDWWGNEVFGKPAPASLVHPIFKANNDGDLQLEAGQLDGSQQFTAQIWKMWEDKKKPVGTYLKEKPYYMPGSMPSLIFNVAKKGLDNVGVRKAIAHAINYGDIASKAMSDYSDQMQASIILPKGSEEKYFDQAAADKSGWKFDKEKAIQILEEELKCTKGSDGIYSLPDGTRLGPWKLQTPTGWTDWNTSCEIIAKSCKDVGIDVQTNFPQAATMIDAMQNGNFDLVHYSYAAVGPATPWQRFRDYLGDEGVAPVGQRAFWNYGRFKNAEVTPLLKQVAIETDEAKAKELYGKLDEIFRTNIPAIPVMYRPSQFFEFNQGTWTNFPTEDNPYGPPTWKGAGRKLLWNIKKVGA